MHICQKVDWQGRHCIAKHCFGPVSLLTLLDQDLSIFQQDDLGEALLGRWLASDGPEVVVETAGVCLQILLLADDIAASFSDLDYFKLLYPSKDSSIERAKLIAVILRQCAIG